MEQVQEKALVQRLPVEAIVERENPRRRFDPEGIEELARSLARHGMLQPVVVRRTGDNGRARYELVAGGRRLRAARKLGWREVPAIVREDLDGDAAFEAAVAENVVRADMSPAEEAWAVKRVVERCGGDVDEAARRLGRSPRFVRARLALLHCAPSVLEALMEGKIKLGVAELLAGVPREVQEATLPKIIEQGRTVQELRQGILQKLARKLAEAAFDTAGCRGCPRNSSTLAQQDLFGETIGEGYCQDPGCWREKTLEWVRTVKRAELADEYPRVAVEDEDADYDSVEVVSADGPRGVGDTQFRACQTCGNYGALIRTEPGREGEVLRGVCFDPVCLDEKAKAYQQRRVEALRQGSAESAEACAKRSKAEAKPKEPTTRAVRDEAWRMIREAAAGVAERDAHVQRALILSIVLGEAAHMPGALRWKMDRAEVFRRVYRMSADDQRTLLMRSIRWILGEEDGLNEEEAYVRLAAAVLGETKTSLAGKVKLTEEFLRGHRRVALVPLLESCGFAAWYDQRKGKGAFQKLVKGKVADIVRTVLESGFDLGEHVPEAVQRAFEAAAAERGVVGLVVEDVSADEKEVGHAAA